MHATFAKMGKVVASLTLGSARHAERVTVRVAMKLVVETGGRENGSFHGCNDGNLESIFNLIASAETRLILRLEPSLMHARRKGVLRRRRPSPPMNISGLTRTKGLNGRAR